MSEAAQNRSPEHRRKLSESHQGKCLSPEHRAKISAATLGKPKSAEHSRHISEGKRGKLHSAEIRAKMSVGQRKRFADPTNHPLYGKHHTVEARAKMSQAHIGKCCGPGNPMYGKRHTIEAKQKMSEAHRGKHCGAKNGRWKGGRVPYGMLWPEQRIRARNRDDFTCQKCGITEEQLGEQLCVHHIVPFRESTDNSLNNLICLCGNHGGNSCHLHCEHHPEDCPEPRKNWLLTEGVSNIPVLQML